MGLLEMEIDYEYLLERQERIWKYRLNCVRRDVLALFDGQEIEKAVLEDKLFKALRMKKGE